MRVSYCPSAHPNVEASWARCRTFSPAPICVSPNCALPTSAQQSIADAMNAPKQIVRDQNGEPIGIAPARDELKLR
jgi:hypothetical protein